MNDQIGLVTVPFTVAFKTKMVPDLKDNEILIEIHSSCLCGSDLHIFKGRHPAVKLPVTIGHEFAGVVVKTGEQAKKFKIGDRVTVEPSSVCGVCEACRTGHYSYCTRISFLYREGNGAMCKYIAVREDFTYLLPDAVSDDAGAMIEPLAVAVHATRRGDIRLGERILVIGAGAIGILVAALCYRSGAKTVLLVDRVDYRLAKAREIAPILTINTSENDLRQAVQDTFGPNGPDKVFECVGLQDTLNDAMALVRMGGLVTVVGIFEQPQAMINAALFVSREIRVQGSQSYCFDFQTAIDLAPEIRPERLITHSFPMSQLQCALNMAIDRTAESVKIVVHPDW